MPYGTLAFASQLLEGEKWKLACFVKVELGLASHSLAQQDLAKSLPAAMYLYQLTLQRSSQITHCVQGNFSGTKQQVSSVAKPSSLW